MAYLISTLDSWITMLPGLIQTSIQKSRLPYLHRTIFRVGGNQIPMRMVRNAYDILLMDLQNTRYRVLTCYHKNNFIHKKKDHKNNLIQHNHKCNRSTNLC